MANQPGKLRFGWLPYWNNPAPASRQPRNAQRPATRASPARKPPAAPVQAPPDASPSQPHQDPIPADDQPAPAPPRAIRPIPSQSQDPTPDDQENAKSPLKTPTTQPQRTTRSPRSSPSPSPSPSRKSAKLQPPSSPGRPAESPKSAPTPKTSRAPSPSLSPSPSKDANFTTQAAAAEELQSAQPQYNHSASGITSPKEEPSEFHPVSPQPAIQLQDTQHEVEPLLNPPPQTEVMQNLTQEGSLPTEEDKQITENLIPHPLVSENNHEKSQETHEPELKEEISTQLLEEKSEIDAIPKQSVPIKDIPQEEETHIENSESANHFQPSEEKVKQVKEDNLTTELELIKEVTPLRQESQTEIQSDKSDQSKVESNYPRQPSTSRYKESNGRRKLSLAISESDFEPNIIQPERAQVKEQRMMTPNSSDASSANRGKSSFQQEIREGIQNLVQKLSIEQPNYLGREKAVSIITLAGENKGATMYISSETFNKADGSPTTAKKKFLGENSSQDPDENAAFAETVNSNVQSINNSLVNESSCIEEDPGVHLTCIRKMNKPGRLHHGTELAVENKKNAVITASAQKSTYEPNMIRKRYQLGPHPQSNHTTNQKNDPDHSCYECPYNSNIKDSTMEF